MQHLLLEGVHGFASLVETIDVEVGEVRGRLVQVVVKRAAQTAAETIVAAHVHQLLVKLLVRNHLFYRHASRFSNVERSSLLCH